MKSEAALHPQNLVRSPSERVVHSVLTQRQLKNPTMRHPHLRNRAKDRAVRSDMDRAKSRIGQLADLSAAQVLVLFGSSWRVNARYVSHL